MIVTKKNAGADNSNLLSNFRNTLPHNYNEATKGDKFQADQFQRVIGTRISSDMISGLLNRNLLYDFAHSLLHDYDGTTIRLPKAVRL